MIDEIVAKRYADAFIAYARESIGQAQAVNELGEIKRLVRDMDELRAFLESGDIAPSEKAALLDTVFGKTLSEATITFIKLLIDNQRINRLLDIAEYARLKYAHGGELDALLKTSYPLDTDVIERIKNALERRMESKLHLYVELDPSLLGGVSVTMGNIMIDGSVRRRLEDLREKLEQLHVV